MATPRKRLRDARLLPGFAGVRRLPTAPAASRSASPSQIMCVKNREQNPLPRFVYTDWQGIDLSAADRRYRRASAVKDRYTQKRKSAFRTMDRPSKTQTAEQVECRAENSEYAAQECKNQRHGFIRRMSFAYYDVSSIHVNTK